MFALLHAALSGQDNTERLRISMDARPKIFISTVTKELKSAREKVANTLRLLHFEPIIQEEFTSHTGVVREMLEKELAPCAAVIQIVGHRYGWDVYGAPDPTEVMSYTHYEAFYAHRKPIPIWYLTVTEDYIPDFPNDEDAEKRAMQAAYRVKVQRTGHLHHTVADIKDVELVVFRMQDDLDLLRPACFQRLPLLNAAGAPSEATSATISTPMSDAAELEKMMRGLLSEFVLALQQAQQGSTSEDESRKEEELYARLGTMLGKTPDEARAEIQSLAKKTKADPKESPLARAKAAYALKEYGRAETLALEAAFEAANSSPPNMDLQINAFRQAAKAASEQIQFKRALNHYRSAAGFTSEERDVLEWAGIQNEIGWLLYLDGQYDAQSTLMHRVWQVCESAGQQETSTSLYAHLLWANALDSQGKYFEAEKEHRAVLASGQRIFGPEHPDTLASWGNLANVLHSAGKYSEAEKEYRALFTIQKRILGSEHLNTLKSLMNIATALNSNRKYAEAEQEYRTVLALQERVLSPKHPDTLMSRMGLFTALYLQGKHDEAERGYRAVLAVQESSLGLEHPDVFRCCLNFSYCLEANGKIDEALRFAQRALTGWTKVLGEQHPDTQAAKRQVKDLEGK